MLQCVWGGEKVLGEKYLSLTAVTLFSNSLVNTRVPTPEYCHNSLICDSLHLHDELRHAHVRFLRSIQ